MVQQHSYSVVLRAITLIQKTILCNRCYDVKLTAIAYDFEKLIYNYLCLFLSGFSKSFDGSRTQEF